MPPPDRPPPAPRRGPSAGALLVLAALSFKLYFFLPDGQPVFSAASIASSVRRAMLVGVASHAALFAGLAGLVSFSPRGGRAVAVGLNLLITTLAYADLLYARYAGFHFSYAEFELLADAATGMDTAYSFLRLSDLVFFVEIPLVAALAWWLDRRRSRRSGPSSAPSSARSSARSSAPLRAGWWRLAAVGAAVYFVGLVAFMARHKTDPPWFTAYDLSRPYNRRKLSYPASWALNLAIYALPTRHYELPATPPPGLPTPSPDRGSRRPDILVIHLEALAAGVPEMRFEGELVMPFLASLKDHGAYFPNGIASRRRGGSSDSIAGVLSGFFPSGSGNFYLHKVDQPPYFLDRLKDAGYSTKVYANYPPEFQNCHRTFARLGVDTVFSAPLRKWETELVRCKLSLPGDLEFMAAVDELLPTQPRPRFAFLGSLTTHGGYPGVCDEPEVRRVLSRPPVDEDARLSGYRCAAAYFDRALRVVLEPRLPAIAAGELVVALYGDHGPGFRVREPPPPDLHEVEAGTWDVPVYLLYGPLVGKGSPRRVAITDLTATLAALAGIDYRPGDLGGRDLTRLAPDAPLVTPWRVFLPGGGARAVTAGELRRLEWGYAKLGCVR